MRYVIVGGSAAGVEAAATIRRHDGKSPVTVISDEKFPLYSRCLLTYLIAGSIDESKLYFKARDFYEEKKIKAYLGKKAVSIDRAKKTVSLDDGTAVPYDRLLLATGASPKSVDVPGIDKEGVFTVRKIDDARAIIKTMGGSGSAIVLGGGLIGLRDAYALKQREKKVTVVVKSPQILSQMLDADAAGIVASLLTDNGIEIKTGVAAREVLGGKSVEGVVLDNGETLDCRLVVIGKGVTPNADLASSCGVRVGEGIAVDDFLRTSDESIYAAGDVAETFDVTRESKRINALWPCAVEQGEVAGLNMVGRETAYDGSLSMNSLDFFGLGCISMGTTKPKKEEGCEILSTGRDRVYKKFVVRENRIVGMVLVGDLRPSGVVSTLIRNKIDISGIKHLLLREGFDYAKIMPLVKKNINKFKEEEYNDTVITY